MKTTTTAKQSLDEALDAFMAKQPKEQDCPDHPGQKQKLSRPLTRSRACVTAHGGYEFVSAVYSSCPLCERDRLRAQGVPLALVHATFENWTPRTDTEREHLELVREFAAQVRRGFLFLLGPVGTGKSHLGVAVLRTFSAGLFVRQVQLLRQLRQHYHNDAVANPIAGAQETRLLVLDELGVSGGGRDELPMLDEILASRYEQQLPTVITSNLSWEEISTALGERLADRLNEACFRVLVFAGKSHRAKRRDNYFAAGERKP
jgi:DNA replication protein DnaC